MRNDDGRGEWREEISSFAPHLIGPWISLEIGKISVLFEMLFYGEMEKNLRPNLIQHSLQNISRVSPNDESWKINPIFVDAHLSSSDGSYIEAPC